MQIKKIAGWDWYRSFMQRHPEITVRMAQNISHARAQCMNRPMVDAFFNMYEQQADELLLRVSPHAVYNADESGLQLHLRPGKVLAAKGDRSVLQVTNSERGQNVTVVACCNAVGNFIPPMVIFKGQRFKPEFADGAPPGTLIKMMIHLLMIHGFSVQNVSDGAMNRVALHFVLCSVVQSVNDTLTVNK